MKYWLLFIMIMLAIPLLAQDDYADYVFFDDSPTETSYDPSWGFVNAPSQLERVGQKFPVVTDPVFQGDNCLKLHWTSQSGGDWGIAVAAIGWPGHDINLRDTLSFWVYSDSIIEAGQLPLMYLEDLDNQKTDRFSLADYSTAIPDSEWIQVKIPLEIFVAQPGDAGLTRIKTIFYGQDVADDVEHTLYLDEIRMYIGAKNDTVAPGPPTGLTAKGADCHVDLFWEANTEEDLKGYNIYRSLGGGAFTLVGYCDKGIPMFSDYVGQSDVTAQYKITAVDVNYNQSDFSSIISADTRAFSDEELLTMVQGATFRYFWDYAHPVSGLARERTPGGENTVTIGGSGFGVMALIVGIERGFISREEGAERLLQSLNFLKDADRFHGAWPHWMNGETGEVIPFSQYDDGGDLVETAFMIQGLLAARQYFNSENETEQQIDSLITNLWESVEWDWYRRTASSNYLYWHWSPNYDWEMNFPLIGPNETMITYLLAMASPTHNIPARLYEDGWASSPNYENGKSFYGYPLWVGWDYGGPLFFAHYSFLGFDPRGIRDAHCNYFLNNRNHTLINRAWCIDNPGGYEGYGENCWGLTASDDPFGYSAHEPTAARDNGTITPTAALASFPYTPDESMAALKHFYYEHGERLWGPFGFKDAFNLAHDWFAGSYIAIDQGPIIVMIENYRTGLVWDKFMANPEIQPMLDTIGFVADTTSSIETGPIPVKERFRLLDNHPNPFNPRTQIRFYLATSDWVQVKIYDIQGREVAALAPRYCRRGYNAITWNGKSHRWNSLGSGIYLYRVSTSRYDATGKMVMLK